MVQGQADEVKLVAAAKSVASSTAQLLIACQVKADARSENNRRLQVSATHTHAHTHTHTHSPVFCVGEAIGNVGRAE